MNKTNLDKILEDFKKTESTGVDIAVTKEKVEEKFKLTPTQEIQEFLAKFTAMLLAVFFIIPFLYLAAGIISFSETLDTLKTVMALLGSITGAVWGYYFHSINSK